MLFVGNKEYVPKFVKFGFVLVKEGIVSHAQLGAALELKREHEDRLLGEIITSEFAVPELEIEKVYLSQVIIPFIEYWFFKELSKKIKVEGWSVEGGITRIEVTLKSYSRQMTRSSSYATVDGNLTVTASQASLTKVRALIEKLIIYTNFGQELVFEELHFELDPGRQHLVLENPSVILEARIRIMQLLRKGELVA